MRATAPGAAVPPITCLDFMTGHQRANVHHARAQAVDLQGA
jgi:hypothetical protein